MATVRSSRFGDLEIPDEAVIDFPSGLIGLGGHRYALLSRNEDATFAWLHSLDDPELAIPVTNPWQFFSDYEVELSDEEADRVGLTDVDAPSVYVTVRAAETPEEFFANLRAPILIHGNTGHQVINLAPEAPVRAPLFDGPAENDQAA